MTMSEDLHSQQQLLLKPPSNGGDDGELEDCFSGEEEFVLEDKRSPGPHQSLTDPEKPPETSQNHELELTSSSQPVPLDLEASRCDPKISGQAGLLQKCLTKLSKPLTINDFMTLDYGFNFDDAISDLNDQWKESKKFKSTSMVGLLMFCVKSQLNFSKIILDLELNNEEDFMLAEQDLFLYLLENADDNFRTFLFNVCSQYMPIPIYTRRYFSKSPGLFHCWTQALHIYEKQINVISFSLANQQDSVPLRTVAIVNSIFAKSFQTSAQTELNEGSLWVQFDRNCEAPRFQSVILKSGPSEPALIEKAVRSGAFDIILLHYLVESNVDAAVIDYRMKNLQAMSKKVKIYALVQSHYLEPEVKKTDRVCMRIFEACSAEKKSDWAKANISSSLLKQCWNDLKEWYFDASYPDYEKCVQGRDQSLRQMLGFLYQAGWISRETFTSFSEDQKKVTNMLYDVLRSKEPKGNEMMPMNFYQSKICRKKLQIREENFDLYAQGKTRQLQEKLNQFQLQLQFQSASKLIQTFLNLLKKPGFLLQKQIWISNILKGLFIARVIPIKDQIGEAQRSPPNSSESELDKQHRINKLKKKEASQMFSLELFFREIYFLSRHHKEFEAVYSKIVSEQIQSAQPIELIDGDNLLFTEISEAIKQLYQEQFVTDKDDITVISIVGPQSSGKSLLLKFLFGTQFFSSEGRCTKGVYFSLLRMKMKNGQLKYILLLDTEGIQSGEARDFQFDSRVVYFILCVSNIVLVCNKQEMNAQMTATLQLGIDNWMNAKAEVSKNPKIFIIMNKMTTLNDDLLKNAEREIRSQIETDEEDKLPTPKVFGIPVFFQVDDFGPGEDQVRQISKKFLACIQELRNAIVKECGAEETKTCQSFDKWFEQAQNLWNITDDFTGLHQYLSLKEKRDAYFLGHKISEIVDKHLIREEGSIIYQEITAEMERLFATEAKTYEAIFSKLSPVITAEFDEMKDKAIRDYEQYTKQHRFNKKLTNKYRTTIERHRRAEETNFKLYFQNKVSMKLFTLSKQTGNQEIQDEVQKIVNQNASLSVRQAEDHFENIWKTVLLKLEKNNKDENQFENLNGFIRDEFSRLNRILERQNLNNEVHARTCLLRSSSLHLLRSKFTEILKTCQPVYPLNEIRPTQGELLQLSHQRNSLLKMPEGLIVLQRPVFMFDKAKMVEFVANSLEKYEIDEVYSYGLAIKLRKGFRQMKKDQKTQNLIGQVLHGLVSKKKAPHYVEEVFGWFNEELAFLNLKFDTSPKTLWKFHVDTKSRNDFYNRMEEIIDEEMSNPENFTVIGESGPPQIREPLLLIRISNAQEQNRYIAEVSTMRYETLNYVPEDRRNLQVGIDEGAVQICQYSEDFVVFLRALLNEVDFNQVTSSMVQEAIGFLNFTKVFGLIEDIIAAQIVINEGERVSISSKEQLEGLLEGLKLPQDNRGIQQQVALHEKVVERRQGVCEQVLTGISNQVIAPLEAEFGRVNLGLSQACQSALFCYAQGIMARIWELGLEVAERIPIMNFLAQKDSEKKLAVARMTCKDEEIDQSWARLMVENVQGYLQQEGKNLAHQQFKQRIQQEVEVFQKKDIVSQMENQALKIYENQQARLEKNLTHAEEEQIKEIIKFYMEPTKALEEQAKDRFNERKQAILKIIQDDYSRSVSSQLRLLREFLVELRKSLSEKGCEKKPASEIMKKRNGVHEDVRPARWALAQYFVLFASSKWCRNQSLSFTKDIQMQAQGLPEVNKVVLNLQILNGIRMTITNKAEITNLFNFCSNAIAMIDDRLSKLVRSPALLANSEIIKNTLNQLINTYRGCQEVCPLCRRQCDQNHGDREENDLRQHKCSNGHQLQGFGGNKHYHNNKAVTWTCEVLEDDDPVIYNRQKVKFKQFKMEHVQWDFQSQNRIKRDQERKKFIDIWNLIGPQLCQAYRESGLEIQFDRAEVGQNPKKFSGDAKCIEKRHFVFVLDSSGSMNGQPWRDLMTSYETFVTCLNQNRHAGTTISVVRFDDEATVEFSEKDPSTLPKINYSGDGTNFHNALRSAFSVCNSSHLRYEQIDVYFMSDGNARKPDLQNWTSASFKTKLKFYSVAFSSNACEKTLRGIADEIGGKFTKALNLEELKQSMIQMLVVLNPYES